MLLDFFAELFVRCRWVVALFILLVTLLATWGHLRESRSPLKTRSEAHQQQQGSDQESEESEETEVSEALLVVQAEDFRHGESKRCERWSMLSSRFLRWTRWFGSTDPHHEYVWRWRTADSAQR